MHKNTYLLEVRLTLVTVDLTPNILRWDNNSVHGLVGCLAWRITQSQYFLQIGT